MRRINALVRSSARLAAGDFTARSQLPHGRDELGQLTMNFDLMAQAMEQRDFERRQATSQVQQLTKRIAETQEMERRHLARELHDEIGQSLTVAEMNLQAMLGNYSSGVSRRRLKDSIQAVERVAQQVHSLALNLRPSILDDLGLEPALRWYANQQSAMAGLRTKFLADAFDDRLDPMIETECFRVAQEAMTNVVRHAKATALAVELHREDQQLHLLIRDDGVGFDVTAEREEAARGTSLGLLSMEERATMAGGGIIWRSAPGQGTEVHAWFPLKWRTVALEHAQG
jgi:signal transduction histidine kinase